MLKANNIPFYEATGWIRLLKAYYKMAELEKVKVILEGFDRGDVEEYPMP